MEDLTKTFENVTVSSDAEKSEYERLDIFFEYFKKKKSEGVLNPGAEMSVYEDIAGEAERLKIKDRKGVTILVKHLFDDQNIIEQITQFKDLFLLFTRENERSQRYLLNTIRDYLNIEEDVLRKVYVVLKKLYLYNIISEKILLEYSVNATKKIILEHYYHQIEEYTRLYVKFVKEKAETDENAKNSEDLVQVSFSTTELFIYPTNQLRPRSAPVDTVTVKSVENVAASKDAEKPEIDRCKIFLEYCRTKKEEGILKPGAGISVFKVLTKEAERLKIRKHKRIWVLVQSIFDSNIINQIHQYKELLHLFTHECPESQGMLLNGITCVVWDHWDLYLKKITIKIFNTLYYCDIITDEVLTAVSKFQPRHIVYQYFFSNSKATAKDFVNWLKGACQEDADEEEWPGTLLIELNNTCQYRVLYKGKGRGFCNCKQCFALQPSREELEAQNEHLELENKDLELQIEDLKLENEDLKLQNKEDKFLFEEENFLLYTDIYTDAVYYYMHSSAKFLNKMTVESGSEYGFDTDFYRYNNFYDIFMK